MDSFILFLLSTIAIGVDFWVKRKENNKNKSSNKTNWIATLVVFGIATINLRTGCENEVKGRSAEEKSKSAEVKQNTADSLIKQMLKFQNNEDSLIIITPYRSGDYIGFSATNLGYYPVQTVVINFPNKPYIDSILRNKGKESDISLSPEIFENWRKQVEIYLDGRRSINFYKVIIPEFDKNFEITFDVKWSNRFIRYSYILKFQKSSRALELVSQSHNDIWRKQKFTLIGSTPSYQR
ncbi:hypothetical protein [Paracnuella aquatica]|uniref:hypothetical protein n=1 Tax=Paracnuella aquatica TaxID=2268757 RepID=UPI000F4DE438|nr:hypothetical protein [Paracnuella aquatica]RPD50647.1 hypothetical protein DRJ53_06920 [Paracnuella aquatica]